MTTAAFFRAEGVLLKRGPISAAAWLAANGKGLRERAFRLGQLAVAAPLAGLLSQNDRTLSSRLAWAACRGMSEDRLAVLGVDPGSDTYLYTKDPCSSLNTAVFSAYSTGGWAVQLLPADWCRICRIFPTPSYWYC